MIFKPLHLTVLLLRENPIHISIIEPLYDMVFQLTGYIVILTECQTLQCWLHISHYEYFFYIQIIIFKETALIRNWKILSFLRHVYAYLIGHPQV